MRKVLLLIIVLICSISLFSCSVVDTFSDPLEPYSSETMGIQVTMPVTFNTVETLSENMTVAHSVPLETDPIEVEPFETEPFVTELPETEPPVIEPPTTEPPVTEPPVTEPPTTEPPVTEPPVTEPPVTEPPVTEPPTTEPPTTEPPTTEPPTTEPPVTEPPATEPLGPQPSGSGIPAFQKHPVNFYVTVMVPQLQVRTGPGTEYAATSVVSYGRYIQISIIDGTLDYLWGYFSGGWICLDYTDFYVNESIYMGHLNNMEIFSNTTSQTLPITIIHKMVTEHFSAPLPAGKTTKKAIVIGYDGFRTDGLDNVKDLSNSGVMHIMQQGGLYHAFTGGVKGSNEQLTITAPSWMAATTGGWDEYNGVSDNQTSKNDAKTFLTALAETGHSVAMVVSWADHINIAYQPDVQYAAENSLLAQYIYAHSDTETIDKVQSFVAKSDGISKTATEDPDVIFCVLEYADTVGHSIGYGNYVEEYIEGCQTVDKKGYELIQSIESRDTYAQEDWLIIIATDHGGIVNGHGSQMAFDRMIWIASNKEIGITKDNLEYALH